MVDQDIERDNNLTPVSDVIEGVDFAPEVVRPEPSPHPEDPRSLQAMLAGSLRDEDTLRNESPGPMYTAPPEMRENVGMGLRELPRFAYRLRQLSPEMQTRVLNLVQREGMRWQDAIDEVENRQFWYNLGPAQQDAWRHISNLRSIVTDTLENEVTHGVELKEAICTLAASSHFDEVADLRLTQLLQPMIANGDDVGTLEGEELRKCNFWFKVVELLTLEPGETNQYSVLRLCRRLAVLRLMSIKRIKCFDDLLYPIELWLDACGDRLREREGIVEDWDFWSVWAQWESRFWRADGSYCKLTWDEADGVEMEVLLRLISDRHWAPDVRAVDDDVA
ncbi:hypothetical protein LTR85_011101 [Meristemomyces frigidus]|nr:hypothetical protein LTR85_011101 [Meristemomyces frigidus]